MEAPVDGHPTDSQEEGRHLFACSSLTEKRYPLPSSIRCPALSVAFDVRRAWPRACVRTCALACSLWELGHRACRPSDPISDRFQLFADSLFPFDRWKSMSCSRRSSPGRKHRKISSNGDICAIALSCIACIPSCKCVALECWRCCMGCCANSSRQCCCIATYRSTPIPVMHHCSRSLTVIIDC